MREIRQELKGKQENSSSNNDAEVKVTEQNEMLKKEIEELKKEVSVLKEDQENSIKQVKEECKNIKEFFERQINNITNNLR